MAAPGVATKRPAGKPLPTPATSLRPRRRPWLAVGSLLLMVVTSGTFVLVHQRADAYVSVLVVARPVAAGQVLTAEDLRNASVAPGAGADVVRSTDMSHVVGHPAAVPLVEGSLLSRRQLGPAAWPPEGQVVVAVPVKTGRLAEGVAAGSHVLVVEVEKDAGTAGQVSVRTPVPAVVVSVRPGKDSSGTTTISLMLPRQDAVTVAGSSAELSVALARE